MVELRDAIRERHGCDSISLGSVRVRLPVADPDGWDGEVQVLALEGHPTASRCYAWRRAGAIVVVLHEPPVDGAEAAVRQAMARKDRG